MNSGKYKLIIVTCGTLFLTCTSPHNPVSFERVPFELGETSLTAYFDLDVQLIFNRSCAPGCHEVDRDLAPQIGVQETGLVLTVDRAYESMFGLDGSKNGPLVLPGKPDDSLLIWKIETKPPASEKRFGRRMPATLREGLVVDGAPLSDQEISLFREWIATGARKTNIPPMPPMHVAISLDVQTVEVTFRDLVAGTVPEVARRYTVTGGLEVLSASVNGLESVLLTTSPQQPGVDYALSIYNSRRVEGPAIFRFVPTILQVVKATSIDSITIDLLFSEPLEPSSASKAELYDISGLIVLDVSIDAPGVVRLTTTPQVPDTTYTVIVSGVQSLKGGVLKAGEGDRTTFRYIPPIFFSLDVQPIFDVNCAFVGCHPSSNPQGGLSLESGLSYSNLVNVASRIKPTVNRVSPGEPENSLIIQKLEGASGIGSRMPLGGVLPDDDIETIRRWIAAGAEDN